MKNIIRVILSIIILVMGCINGLAQDNQSSEAVEKHKNKIN